MRLTNVILTSIIALATGAPQNYGLDNIEFKKLLINVFGKDFGLGKLSRSTGLDVSLSGDSRTSNNFNLGSSKNQNSVENLNIGSEDINKQVRSLINVFGTDFGLGKLSRSFGLDVSFSGDSRTYNNFNLGSLKNQNSFDILNIGSKDIIKQVRSLAENVKSTLRNLNNDVKSAAYVNKIINDENNVCIQDLDEAIDDIEYGTQLVEAAGDEIRSLVSKVNSFQTLSEPSDVVREISNIFRILEPLVQNLFPDSSSFVCQGKATPKQAFGSLQNLAYIINSLAIENEFNFNSDTKRKLKDAGNAVASVANFLDKLRRNFSKLKQICTSDKQYNLESLTAIGDTIEDLAEMFKNLGDSRNSKDLGKGKAFVNKLVVSMK